MHRLLLIALALLLALPHPADAQTSLDCEWGGTWLISYTIIQQWSNPVSSLAQSMATETGAASVDALCAGGAPTFTGDAEGQIAVFDVRGQVCGAEYTSSVSGSIGVSGKFPVFSMRFDAASGGAVCYLQREATSWIPRTFRFITNSIDEGYVYDGDVIEMFYDDPQMQSAPSRFIANGGEIDYAFVFDIHRYPHPEILDAASQYRRYFLQTVPLTSRFTTTVDWDHSPEPSAMLRIHDNDPKPMVVDGDEVYFDIPVGGIEQTGEVALRIIFDSGIYAYGSIRSNRTPTPEQVGMVVVPMPSWATNSGLDFSAHPDGEMVMYRATHGIPETPLETPIVEIPDFVPYVGGKWGLAPVQMIVNVGATSLGGPRTEDIEGTGTLYFAGDEHEIVFDGSLSTNMTAEELEIIESPFSIELSEPVTMTRSMPLIALVPGVAALYAVPYVGDLVAALSSFASIQAQITADVSGYGTLGVTPNDELGITSGSVNYQLGGTVAASASLYLAWLQISGNITGSVDMALAPQPAISDCNLILGFTVQAGAVGIGSFTLPEFTQVPLCN
jgi:hypothetical protein